VLGKKSIFIAHAVGLTAAILVSSSASRAAGQNDTPTQTDEQLRTDDQLANDIVSGAFNKEASEGAALIVDEDRQRVEAGGGLIPGTSVLNDELKSSCGTTSQCLDAVAKQAKEMPNIEWPDAFK
jgi:hypothetical protein